MLIIEFADASFGISEHSGFLRSRSSLFPMTTTGKDKQIRSVGVDRKGATLLMIFRPGLFLEANPFDSSPHF